jgi:DNA-binding transcriptional LysR family regulator
MELRHLRYFVAVVQGKGFREAARRLYVAQPAISQTLANLETEIGVKLFTRSGRSVQLTPQGEVFYSETVRTLDQARHAVESAQRAARGEVGKLAVAFCGAATYAFLPELVRNYKAKFPGIKIVLKELTPAQQEGAFAQGAIDVGFTRPISDALSSRFHSKLLYRDPLLAALPASRQVKGKRIKIEELAGDRFILFHRDGFPALFDTIIRLCNERGFSPKVDDETDMLTSALSLVAADQGVSIVPGCAVTLGFQGVQLLRLVPDTRVDLVLAWPKTLESPALSSFLELVEASKNEIRRKTRVV